MIVGDVPSTPWYTNLAADTGDQGISEAEMSRAIRILLVTAYATLVFQVTVKITLWQTNSLLLKMAIDMIDLPIRHCAFP